MDRSGPMLGLKLNFIPVDQKFVNGNERLPVKAGPVPDRLTIWPVDDGRLRPRRNLPGVIRL
jgi:hypothetical protein